VARTLVRVPARAAKGQVIEIKALVGHVMETGFRHTETGALIPRDIIRSFACSYNGEVVFRADFHPAIAANPLIEFFTVATESGNLEFRWTGDNGFSAQASAPITVE
jgi:sulfur-oxidizing protein SoxZ